MGKTLGIYAFGRIGSLVAWGASADVSFTGRFEAPPLTPHPEAPQLGTEERPQTLPEPHLILQNEPDEKPETVPDIERLTVFMNGRRLSKATLAAIARAA